MNVPELFGSMVFNDREMKKSLSSSAYNALCLTMRSGCQLPEGIADEVAEAMKNWAIKKGATHFTHWFQPMTGLPAEKHDSFIEPSGGGAVIMTFSGKELIKGEPDASSFPTGGIRETCEARGYTAWDPTSYAFVRGTTLYIPTCFISYTGEVLDKKTPLLKSEEIVSRAALRLTKLFGVPAEMVNVTCGVEQEYFLIDRELYNARKDLIYTGRTLFGAAPPKGQELEDQYFGSIKPRVLAFMEDVDKELWELGVNAKTRHNEVAPCQHEIAPVFSRVNVAADHNLLTMEVLKTTAEKHGLMCLLHEKPFSGVNGSGKHNNWSMSTDSGLNLFNPGKHPEDNYLFLCSIVSVVAGVHRHADLLRLSVASAGNDHRLGASEAPPAIISVFLGDEIKNILDSIESGGAIKKTVSRKTSIGVNSVANFETDSNDRNRTSPVAFTGNKFEFRALGSALNISCPNVMINISVAEAMDDLADLIEKDSGPIKDRAIRAIKKLYSEHKAVVFNGNNYSDEWINVESKKRGLPEIKTTPEALMRYTLPENLKLFEKLGLFTPREAEARKVILLEQYSKVINIEAHTMFKITAKEFLPACASFAGALAGTISSKASVGASHAYETDVLAKVSSLTDKAYALNNKLEEMRKEAALMPLNKRVMALKDSIIPGMNDLRSVIDSLELLVDRDYWPMPSYGDMLFREA